MNRNFMLKTIKYKYYYKIILKCLMKANHKSPYLNKKLRFNKDIFNVWNYKMIKIMIKAG